MSQTRRGWPLSGMRIAGRFSFVVRLAGLSWALAITTGIACATDFRGNDDKPAPKPCKVLIIGNSYTYFNNLPRMLEQIGQADKPPRNLSCEMVVEGGATLKKTWEDGKARKAIERGGWDFVVLQEQSTLGITYLVEGQPRIVESPRYLEFARRFDELIRKVGARTVMFAFWARENAPREDHNALAYYHSRVGKDLGALIAPIGFAWQAAQKRDPKTALYQDDRSHPRPEGTYLAALALYATCFGAVPQDLPRRVTGARIDIEGNPVKGGDVTLVELSQGMANAFREAVKESLTASTTYVRDLETHKPEPPVLPKLERGQRPSPESLIGEWTGETKVYPKDPDKSETLTLRLSRTDNSWRADGKISFGGKPTDIIPSIADFQVTDQGISFNDVNKASNGGGIAQYRARFDGKTLRGITEINRPETSLYVIGTWELHKK
jgi:hypothetical protein